GHSSNISDKRLAQAGLDSGAIEFLRDQRIELNAMTSRQLVDFVENKLRHHGISKVIPDSKTLAETDQTFVASHRLSDAFGRCKEELDNASEGPIAVPTDLCAKIEQLLQLGPDMPWHEAVQKVADPDAPQGLIDENEDGEDDDDEEDLSDIDE